MAPSSGDTDWANFGELRPLLTLGKPSASLFHVETKTPGACQPALENVAANDALRFHGPLLREMV